MRPDSPAAVLPRSPRRGSLAALFLGPRGLRAGWGVLLFAALFAAASAAAVWAVLTLFPSFRTIQGWTPAALIWAEIASLVAALLATWVLARAEGRSFAAYGVPLRAAFGRRFWEGSLWGILTISAVIALIAGAGGYSVAGLALAGGEAVRPALLWGLAFLLVGVYEEIFFRGYPQAALTRGMGFWPAAVLISLVFGALHYFLKPMETWLDLLNVSLIGLFFCLTVRRTGDVWFAVGWHFAYNYGSMFLYGGPNTGNDGRPLPGHLLDSSFHGPGWLTGGPMGPQASLLLLPVLAILSWAFHRRFRAVRFPIDAPL